MLVLPTNEMVALKNIFKSSLASGNERYYISFHLYILLIPVSPFSLLYHFF